MSGKRNKAMRRAAEIITRGETITAYVTKGISKKYPLFNEQQELHKDCTRGVLKHIKRMYK